MNIDAVPVALKDRLGIEATGGLLQLLDHAQRDWEADVTARATERFEVRMVGELSAVRVQITHSESSIRQDMATMESGLRQDMAKMESGVCQEMARMQVGLRDDMIDTGLRQEMATGRFELLKWCFLFSIGQVVAMTGILGVMLRLFRA